MATKGSRVPNFLLSLLGLALGLALLVLNPGPAQAAMCRQTPDHRICLLRIERSAKYFWEYRAAVSIDGKARPLEKYDCRRRVRTSKDGRIVAFEHEGAGDLVCQLNLKNKFSNPASKR